MGERETALAADGSLVLDVSNGKSRLRLSPVEVKEMESEGLLAVMNRKARRTDAGRSYLRRALAAGEEQPFAAQHRVPSTRHGHQGRSDDVITVNGAECPLSWLATRRDRSGNPLITAEQHEAGRRLHGDHARAHRAERVTQSWDISGVRGEAPRDRLTTTEAAADARRRVEGALDAAGPGLADVLLAVCCEEVGLETVEKRFGWPARSGKVVLRLALDRLADYYGIARLASGAARSQLLHWGAADYRPRA
jgi:hypothetical protein